MGYSGKIIKGVGGFYTVLAPEGEFVCRARGRFRREGITPLSGDNVLFETDGCGKGFITEILPRKNLLARPAAANIDKLMIVLSASLPSPDYILADKLMVQCEISGITPVLIINKCDEKDDEIYAATTEQYAAAGYKLLSVSAHTGEGMEALKAEIQDRVCCLAGQSAVGKSSIMNAIAPELGLEVGGLSDRTEKGRHTTRHVRLWQVCGGSVLDTPGFSLLDMAALEPFELCRYYPEMRKVLGLCRFPECLHISEPDCAVRPLVGKGISQERYLRYCRFVEELKEKRRYKYD